MPDVCTPMLGTQLSGFAVADCAALGQLDAALAAEANRSATMTSAELDAEVAQILAGLQKRTIAAQIATEAVAKANKALALKATGCVVDIAVEVCVFTRNPVCIGSAYGLKMVYDTASFGVQLYDARTSAEQAEIAIAFGKGRVAMFKGLLGALKPTTPAQSSARAIRSAVRAAKTLNAAGSTVADAKAELEAAVAETQRMESLFAVALANEVNYRAYRAEDFKARRFVVQLLQASYGGSGCRTNVLPIDLP